MIPVAMPQQHSPLKIWQVCSANLFLPLRWVACFRSRHYPLWGSPLGPKLCFFWVCAFLVLGGCCVGLQSHLKQLKQLRKAFPTFPGVAFSSVGLSCFEHCSPPSALAKLRLSQ